MPYIKVGEENSGDIDLYYEDHGSGRPIVLIHGWPLSAASWDRQLIALLAAGYRVITYDRRGFGRSAKPSTGYDADTLALDLHHVMTKLDLREAALVGFSMGGVEVARYLGTHGPERVAKAVFLSAVPPFLRKSPTNPEGVEGAVFDGIRLKLSKDRPAFIRAFLSDFYNLDILGGKVVSDEVAECDWNVAMAASPIATYESVSSWYTDFRPDLAGLALPVLVIHGDADRILPLAATGFRTAESVKGAKLVVVKGGPHGITWTHADEVNASLLDFLETAEKPLADCTKAFDSESARLEDSDQACVDPGH
jgi:pimeloyl-ACP methyl ester carboxylesterase